MGRTHHVGNFQLVQEEEVRAFGKPLRGGSERVDAGPQLVQRAMNELHQLMEVGAAHA